MGKPACSTTRGGAEREGEGVDVGVGVGVGACAWERGRVCVRACVRACVWEGGEGR